MRHRMVGREDGEAHRLRGFIGGIGKIDGIVIAVGNADKQQKMRQTADNIHRFLAQCGNGRFAGGTDDHKAVLRAAGNVVMRVGG